MAILKQLKVPSGVVCNYSRISKAEFFSDAKMVQLTVDLFLSEEERAAGSPLVYQERVQVPFTAMQQDPRNLFYDWLTDFAGSPFLGGTATSDVVETEVQSMSLAPVATIEPTMVDPAPPASVAVEEPAPAETPAPEEPTA